MGGIGGGREGGECNNLALQLDFLFVLDLPINQQATPLLTHNPTQLPKSEKGLAYTVRRVPFRQPCFASDDNVQVSGKGARRGGNRVEVMGGCVLPVLDEDEGEDHLCGLGGFGGVGGRGGGW